MDSQYAVCETIVAEPRVVDVNGELLVQWDGVRNGLPLKVQLLFPLVTRLEDIGPIRPDELQVVFLDEAKNWPDLTVAKQIAEGRVDGMETWVAVLCSRHFTVRYPSGVGPGTFVSDVMMRGDPNTGFVRPGRFQNLSLLERPAEQSA
jgi:hypothetical protein